MIANVYAERWKNGRLVDKHSIGRIRISEPQMCISARQYCELWKRTERVQGSSYYRPGIRTFFVTENGLVARPLSFGGAIFR